MTITAGISDDKQEEALQIIKEQVTAMQQGEITPDELEQTKRGLIGAMTSINDNPAGIIDRNLIGIVEGELRTIDQVVESIRRVEYDACIRVMQDIKLDTTYILRPQSTEPKEQEGAYHGDH